ncbi:MotA/TolQ/ExbB proton channel family protein [uncultured Desulfobacter sp.]|uniref:motility protein A n=1 Tax=uncultured Desulfobacter sp. TaxID=240139 RepID=UPI002AAC3581|nr:MotA/TolQ/ExbB proton channel family protein [uncultured Desulfobacter sp.]
MLQKILPAAGVVVFILLSGTVSELSSIVLNIKSNLIILAGAFVCALMSYPFHLFSDLLVNIRKAFSGQKANLNALIKQIEVLATIRRRDGQLVLDEKSETIDNPFLKMGIEMIADGFDRYTIFKTLEQRYDNFLQARRSQADLINTFIKLMPVFGFVGTIIGLINVLNNMGSPELIGKGVATALLTTFYGLLYANVIFLPIAKKLAEKTKHDAMELTLIIEGVLDIADKSNAKAIGYRLRYCIGDYFQDDWTAGRKNLARNRKNMKLPMKLTRLQPHPEKQEPMAG